MGIVVADPGKTGSASSLHALRTVRRPCRYRFGWNGWVNSQHMDLKPVCLIKLLPHPWATIAAAVSRHYVNVVKVRAGSQ